MHEIELKNRGTSSAAVVELSPPPSAYASAKDLNLTTPFKTGAATQVPRPSAAAAAAASTYDVALSGANLIPEDSMTRDGGNHGNHTLLAVVFNSPCAGLTGCTGKVSVPAGGTVTVFFTTTIVTSLNSTNVESDAATIHASAHATAAANPTALRSEHVDAWKARWARGSVAVEGDVRLAQGINASLYVLRAAIRDDWPYVLMLIILFFVFFLFFPSLIGLAVDVYVPLYCGNVGPVCCSYYW